jgi:hypothetical protein
MADEKTGTLYWHTGGGGSPHTGQIVAREGKSGRDDPLGQGRMSMFPYSWPNSVSPDNSLWGHVMTQGPQGPFGSTVHHDILDGMRVACTMMPDGTPLIHNMWHTKTGPETQGFGGAQGENTYVGAAPKQGK